MGRWIGIGLVGAAAITVASCAKQAPVVQVGAGVGTTRPVVVRETQNTKEVNVVPGPTSGPVVVEKNAPGPVVAAGPKVEKRVVDSGVGDAFIRFDRAFVPVVVLLEQGKGGAAVNAMGTLKEQWRALREEKCIAGMGDLNSRKDLELVEGRIGEAGELMAGGQWAEALGRLDGVRGILLGLRQRNGIEYFLDHLNRYSGPMQQMMGPVLSKRAGELSAAEIRGIRSALGQGKKIWQKVERASFEAGRFGFDEPKVAEMQHLIHVEKWAMESLEQALDGGKQEEIIPAAKSIKPGYARLYMMFGVFPGKE